MSRHTPIYAYESLDETDTFEDAGWTVLSEHHGHMMSVVGRIVSGETRTSMYVVECSCGERFRMSNASIMRGQEKARRLAAQGAPSDE